MMRHACFMVCMVLGLSLISCDRADSTPAETRIDEVIRTTSAPVDALTRLIVQDLVPVELLCPASEDPSTWRPGPEVVAEYQSARLIISNGAGYESWVQTAPLPRSRLVSAADGIQAPLIAVKGETHSHGPEGDHTHEIVLGQVWLDPLNTIAQAEAITAALARTFPEHRDEFVEHFEKTTKELQELHQRLVALDTSASNIYAPINPYGYLARRYNWQGVEIESDPEDWSMDLYAIRMSDGDFDDEPVLILCNRLPEPDVADDILRSHGARVVLWQTGSQKADGSFIDIFRANVERLEEAVRDMRP